MDLGTSPEWVIFHGRRANVHGRKERRTREEKWEPRGEKTGRLHYKRWVQAPQKTGESLRYLRYFGIAYFP